MHFIDVSSIISTGKTLSPLHRLLFFSLTPLCNCLQLWRRHKIPLQFPSTRWRELLEKRIFLETFYAHTIDISLSRTFSFYLSLFHRRGGSIYAAERDTRQWTSNVAILKCRYQSHVHLFQLALLPAFLTLRPAISTSPWRDMELFSLITIDICLSRAMLLWGQLGFFLLSSLLVFVRIKLLRYWYIYI